MTVDTDHSPLPPVPQRPTHGHKGTFGSVLIVGGSQNDASVMVGAPALAALGALRAGAGLAKLMMPAPLLGAALATCPSATGIPLKMGENGPLVSDAVEELDRQARSASVVVIGPGLGHSPSSAPLVLRILQQEDIPVVVDADALGVMASIPDLWRDFRAAAILTPHPGEFRRLAAAFGIAGDPTDPTQRPGCAAELARRLGCVVVLKGAGTIVSDGLRAWTCDHGHVCMATGGTGDVLAGVIAGTLASNKGLPLYDAARIGVQAHALAGEHWARSHGASGGMLAAELAEQVPAALESMRTSARHAD